ncbi:unnamed protein product [Tuber melanosporum]|uniref:(Perigord truffle) hypothetical protein n=1 Tax=Tuber melanosporum (strain Mel28) TaxID=656061 RepID=D5GFB8_TUBMM|nr:uncharacterized protein GSTUM_00006815001 [Tuber melanosporum]CAZ83211.1 unnamed protein product [Tuber melanosporum]
MSSIFTFNPSPPKPASPWANNTPAHPTPSTTPNPKAGSPDLIDDGAPGHLRANNNSGKIRKHFMEDGDREGVVISSGKMVKGLAAEPQMGATEYKLSLARGGKSEARLDQLVTQLLWRLQQSSPYHANSLDSKSPEAISSLVQESQGALYEIGVADDGKLIGLCEEELQESLDTLHIMAARLGCTVRVLRKEAVGTGQMDEQNVEGVGFSGSEESFGIPKVGDPLWVVEAFVQPGHGQNCTPRGPAPEQNVAQPGIRRKTEQLRITLTGATTCGKTTLLGTLSTGEHDNGRGKSRISLLRHRHELVSGITSSVTWEILGYMPEVSKAELKSASRNGGPSRLVNYASGNISSWTDIHAAADGGRIVFLSDSAGNPKFSRTTFKSLIGWAPHYAAFLVTANDDETLGAEVSSGLSKASLAHLNLCLELGLRMIVVFTKRDLGTKTGLKKVFGNLLTILKQGGRKPAPLSTSASVKDVVKLVEGDPEHTVPILFTSSVNGQGVDLLHELIMRLPVPEPPEAPRAVVMEEDCGLSTLFHLEEIYGFQPAHSAEDGNRGAVVGGHVKYGKISIGDELLVGPLTPVDHTSNPPSAEGTPATPAPHPLLSPSVGHLPGLMSKSPDSANETRATSRKRSGLKITRGDDTVHSSASGEDWEWKLVKVVSVRRLRLPVNILFAGEAGTLGIMPIQPAPHLDTPLAGPVPNSQLHLSGLGCETKSKNSNDTIKLQNGSLGTPANSAKAVAFANLQTIAPPVLSTKLRKGMVIFNRPSSFAASSCPQGYTGFTTNLGDEANSLISGSSVVVYIASIRAIARLVSIEPLLIRSDEIFSLDYDEEIKEAKHADGEGVGRKFMFEFDQGRAEWIEVDDKVLIVPGGGKRGLDVFAGRVVERLF